MSELAKLNLNLLKTLEVLLTEQHVTVAATQLGLTQSAISRQLAQLRQAFGDPLLIREGQRYLLSDKARQLQAELPPILANIQALMTPPAFEPARWTGPLVLCSSDYVAQFILPLIRQRLAGQAPRLVLEYQLWDKTRLSQLGDSNINLVSTMLDEVPDNLHGQQIGSDYPVCVMAGDHPLAGKEQLAIEDLLAYDHARVSGGGDKDSFVDRWLASRGLQRRLVLSVPFFAPVLQILCQSRLLLVIPEHIAVQLGKQYAICYKPLPFDVPQHQYYLLWHQKFHHQEAHRWVRQQVLEVMKSTFYSPIGVQGTDE